MPILFLLTDKGREERNLWLSCVFVCFYFFISSLLRREFSNLHLHIATQTEPGVTKQVKLLEYCSNVAMKRYEKLISRIYSYKDEFHFREKKNHSCFYFERWMFDREEKKKCYTCYAV